MLRTRRRNKITRPGGRPHAQTVGGLNAETRGGIEPMGKIFLLTFLFIGLPNCRLLRRKSPPPELDPRVLCWSSVCRSDLDVVAKFTKLFREVFGRIDEELWFGFDALLDVADSLMKNLPDQAA